MGMGMTNKPQTTAQAPRRAAFHQGREIVLIYGTDKQVTAYYADEGKTSTFNAWIDEIEIKEVTA